MHRLYLIYGLSGFVSLGYQVAWFRILVDRFGSTNLTFALVVCNFIGGLGAGALLSERLCRRLGGITGLRDRLRLYGLVELLVTASIGLTLLLWLVPAAAWGVFPYQLAGGVYEPTLAYRFSHAALAVVCIFVPCLFMGVTFPLLCDVYRGRPGAERFPSALYAWNTLGACSGVLVSLFVLLPWLGHARMLAVLAALNLAIALFFLARGGASADAAAPVEAPVAAKDAGGKGLSLLLACAGLSGLLAGALEGDMFKRIDFISTGNSAIMALISFWAILAIFLASWLVRAAPAVRLGGIKIAYVAGAVAYYAAWRFEGGLRALFKGGTDAADAGQTDFHWGFVSNLAEAMVFVGVFVFPAYFCVSLLLPYVCNRIHAGRRHIGFAYGLNTLAFCLGLIAFTHVAPRISVFYSMKLMMVLFAIAAILLLTFSESRRLFAWQPGMALAAIVVAVLVTPAGFDAGYMVKGDIAAAYPVRALKSNGAHTTFVVELPGGDMLYFDRHPMSGTKLPETAYMRLMAHVPLLAHPDPKSALLICYGVGMTASAIATHDTIESIDVVDLNEKVIETAPEFAVPTDAVYRDPRIRFIIDDGRTYLSRSDRRYDLITSEPPPPMQAGVYRLYTREYYEQVLEHLTPRGLMTQWIPTYQMPQEAVRVAIGTFVDVFPHAMLFTGGRREFILVGSPAPIDAALIERRFYEQPAVAADLHRLGARKPVSLLSRFIYDDATLRERFDGFVMSDAHNDFEFLFNDPEIDPPVTGFRPAELLAALGTDRLDCGDELRDVMTHVGRLRYHVPDYPMTVLSGSEDLHLADADWVEIERVLNEAWFAMADDRLGQAHVKISEALALAGEQPFALQQLAMLELKLGMRGVAAETTQRLQAVEPNDESGYRLNGIALWGLGQRDAALDLMRTAVRVDSHSANAHQGLAIVLINSGVVEEGITHLRRALEIQPDRPMTRQLLDNALKQVGRAGTGEPPNPVR